MKFPVFFTEVLFPLYMKKKKVLLRVQLHSKLILVVVIFINPFNCLLADGLSLFRYFQSQCPFSDCFYIQLFFSRLVFMSGANLEFDSLIILYVICHYFFSLTAY